MNSDIPHAATHSSLDIFQKPSILVNFDSGNDQEIFPVSSLDGPNLEFSIATDRHVFLDMQNIFLDLTIKIVQGVNGGNLEYVVNDADHQDEVQFVNNILHSLFSNCDVSFNNELVYSSNGHYAHKAMIDTEISHTGGSKDTILRCQGYTYEPHPETLTSPVFMERKNQTKESNELHLFGRLSVDIFNCDRLLLPNTDIRIKLIKSAPNFCLISSQEVKGFKIKFQRASLHVRQMIVTPSVHRAITGALEKAPARYIYPEMRTKTFIIPGGQNQFIRENVFNSEPIRRLVLVMNKNADFSGTMATNPYNYQKFGLREVRISRGGQPFTSMNTENNVRAYFNTLKSLHFEQDGPAISLADYDHHYILVFDMTSTQQSETEIYYPELIGAGIRIELYFTNNLTDPVEFMVLGERLTSVQIYKDGRVLKDG
jgi:hypothetical protein